MAKINLKLFKGEAEREIDSIQSLKELNEIFKKYLGKKGEIRKFFCLLKSLSEKERKEKGRLLNELKKELEKKISEKKKIFQVTKKTSKEWFDVSVPGKRPALGHLHPLTLVKRKIEEIFQMMGFNIIEGPEIETEWYNFDALNIPKDHPARDLWDTLWLRIENQKMLLRTHTSPVQIRYMERNQPPLKIIVPGRVFRHEATDASHEINFYQLEGLMIDKKKKVTTANFKAIIEEFFKRFFNQEIKIRLRPSYFPFTEPSFEVDLFCINCLGKGCSACQKTGWMEMMGAGMVHPNVLKNSGLNPKFWQGFAFGLGLDRLVMMRYKINDIRLFYDNDLRFLTQF